MFAASFGHLDICEHLAPIAAVDVNRLAVWSLPHVGMDTSSPLMVAAYKGHLPVVRLLVDLGVDTHVPPGHGHEQQQEEGEQQQQQQQQQQQRQHLQAPPPLACALAAASGGHVDVIDFLATQFEMNWVSMVLAASAAGQSHVIEHIALSGRLDLARARHPVSGYNFLHVASSPILRAPWLRQYAGLLLEADAEGKCPVDRQ